MIASTRFIPVALAGFFLSVLASVSVAQSSSETPLPNPQVTITTNVGVISVRLFRDKAPLAVENFLAYVDDGFYDGTIFHRVIPNFMIQGGGLTPDMVEKPVGEPVMNESKNRLHNVRGTLAMARTSDPDSATAQFFINQRTNLRLDWQPGAPGYTVFGEVIDGMSTVDYISTSPVQAIGPHGNVPIDAVIITKIERKSLL
ncbi:peptidylprolyl isomerase [Congregibacter brevis]|uniref:Peptidyl-prolyl cis-trans isomerase n=1 Tax=Congregibacter brevis TaxID=3081201 RepID=A0ABZ0IG30_9GAMM|nr:peptidylprolyl isomerase [Congregibacter sp. IMCC45268]